MLLHILFLSFKYVHKLNIRFVIIAIFGHKSASIFSNNRYLYKLIYLIFYLNVQIISENMNHRFFYIKFHTFIRRIIYFFDWIIFFFTLRFSYKFHMLIKTFFNPHHIFIYRYFIIYFRIFPIQ